MGRKGGGKKGFMKAVAAGPAEALSENTSPAVATDREKDLPELAGTQSESQPAESPTEKQPETMSQLRARHLKEMKEHKKQMDKLGKKQKDEIAARTNEIQERHAAELSDLKKALADDEGSDGGDADESADTGSTAEATAPQNFSELSLYGSGEKKMSKSQRKKQARAAQEAEREERIRAEKEAMGPTERAMEESALLGLLSPLNLSIREVAADGHCMYRALADQLDIATDGQPPQDGFLGLRILAARYMREHAGDYIPFVVQFSCALVYLAKAQLLLAMHLHVGEFEVVTNLCGLHLQDPEDDEDASKQFEEFCHEVEATASWGGQVELGALANALERHIVVYSTDLGKLDMGMEFAGKKETLNVCYMRHAYGLGEHYNSIGRISDTSTVSAED